MASHGGLAHEGTDQVVGDEVHFQFLMDHGRAQAAKHVHMESGFDVIKIEFDLPAPGIKGRQQFDGPEQRVGQGSEEEDLLAASIAGGHPKAHQAHGEGRGQRVPLLSAQIGGLISGLGQSD